MLNEVKVVDLLCHTSCMDELEWAAFVNAAALKSPDLPPPALQLQQGISETMLDGAGIG
jgi:hypothetical protein